MSSQAAPPTLKNLDFLHEILPFLKINGFDPKMVLGAFWGSLGLLLGTLGGLLGAFGGLLGACSERRWGFLEASCGSLGIIFGSCLLRCCFFLLFEALGDEFGLHS